MGTPAPVKHRTVVIDERNMFKIWLDEQIFLRKMTPEQADKEWARRETQGKNWTGPLKDLAGSAKIVYKLARDMKHWGGGRVYFKPGAHGDLVIIKGWPAGRKLLTGTKYRVDNPKIMELQIGKPGIRAAAKESARFGIYFVVAVDVADYLFRDKATLGSLLGALTVDIPSVVIASAVGAAAGSFVAGTSITGLAAVGALACGPLLVAFVVGVAVGYGLYKLDQHFALTDKLTAAYDRGLARLQRAWHELGDEAHARWQQFERSQMVKDLTREARDLQHDAQQMIDRLGRQTELVRGRLMHLF